MPSHFTDSEMSGLADRVAVKLPRTQSDPVSRSEFDALSERVDRLQEVRAEVSGLEERVEGVRANTAANERRMAEALREVARAVRDVDRRSTEGMKELSRHTNEEMGTLKASNAKAHSRMDKYRDRFIGGALVAGAAWSGVLWIVEHWSSLPGKK